MLQRPGRHADNGLTIDDVLVAGDDRVGPDDGIFANRDRSDQDRTRADPAPVADAGLVLSLTVEIGRDRPLLRC